MTVSDGTSTGITIARCDPARDKAVLALAASVWPESVRADHWRELQAAVRERGNTAVVLLAAWEGERLLGAALGQILPGKAAAVWPPQLLAGPAGTARAIGEQLLGELLRELQAGGAALAQALLGRNEQAAGDQLRAAGLAPAADLLYLAAGVHEFPAAPPKLACELVSVAECGISRLAAVVERTYAGTLDCPQIDGLRSVAEVIAGYQGVGVFNPGRWWLASQNGADLGCVLVNLHPDVRHAEIIYLGVVPEARGFGLGLDLTRYAQWTAGLAECEQTVLAVDAANEPAIRVYAAAGFREFDRRTVWIKALGKSRSNCN